MALIYLVRIEGNTTTSSWNDVVKAFELEKNAIELLAELSANEKRDIENGDHDGFRDGHYSIAFDDNVPDEYSKAEVQTCIYNQNTNDWITIYVEEVELV